jgi:AcrR family transcriptional regulator
MVHLPPDPGACQHLAMRMTRQESQERTRARLIAAAGEVFATTGFHAATIDEITEAAGFTRGAFYKNFADKADLFLTVLERATDEQIAEIDVRLAAATAASNDDDALDTVVTWFETTFGPGPLDLAQAEFWPVVARQPAHRERLAANAARVHASGVEAVRAYCERLEPAPPIDPDELASLILALADGLDRHQHLDPDADRSGMLRTGIQALWFGLQAPRI